MSVIIKGMEMPTSCGDCPCLSETYCCCVDGVYPYDCNILIQDTEEGSEFIGRLSNCPLVEVPPHGRLIDADEFIKGHCNLCDGACENTYCDCLSCKETMRCDMIQDFSNAPTVIESDDSLSCGIRKTFQQKSTVDNGACFNGEPSEKVQE